MVEYTYIVVYEKVKDNKRLNFYNVLAKIVSAKEWDIIVKDELDYSNIMYSISIRGYENKS